MIVSTFARTPEKSLPSFKIALVICQEVYSSSKYFPPLMAPKLDGTALVSALKQLDFQVHFVTYRYLSIVTMSKLLGHGLIENLGTHYLLIFNRYSLSVT